MFNRIYFGRKEDWDRRKGAGIIVAILRNLLKVVGKEERMPENLELHSTNQFVEIRDSVNPKQWILTLKAKCACPYLGIILATMSSFFFSLCSAIVKQSEDVNPIELASFR